MNQNLNQGKRFSERNTEIPIKFLNVINNVHNGPNVNIKKPRRSFNTKEEREYFKNLINNKQKTELCKNWLLYNACYFKETCSFAHGEKDLRATNTANPLNYKTKQCNTFTEKLNCRYASRCNYLHSFE